MGFLSLLPYIGAGFVWFPAGIYLLFIGKIWQGVFLLIWGIFAVSMIDNVVRAYIIKGKAQIHPILIILSILGGISLFGFWGVFLGPLIISIAITVFHIYELEYKWHKKQKNKKQNLLKLFLNLLLKTTLYRLNRNSGRLFSSF